MWIRYVGLGTLLTNEEDFLCLSDPHPARERYLQSSPGCLSRTHYIWLWQQEWKKENLLGLDGNDKEQWDSHTATQKVSHVRLRETEDELVWLKNPTVGF